MRKYISKAVRCVLSAPRARPGIDVLPRAGLQVHVRPGIQMQAASEEPPPAYNLCQHKCGQQPVREAHYKKLVGASQPYPPLSLFPCFFTVRLSPYIIARFFQILMRPPRDRFIFPTTFFAKKRISWYHNILLQERKTP